MVDASGHPAGTAPTQEEVRTFLALLAGAPGSAFNRGNKPRLKQLRLLEHFIKLQWSGELKYGFTAAIRAFEREEAGLPPKPIRAAREQEGYSDEDRKVRLST
jgi:hypothetical protein